MFERTFNAEMPVLVCHSEDDSVGDILGDWKSFFASIFNHLVKNFDGCTLDREIRDTFEALPLWNVLEIDDTQVSVSENNSVNESGTNCQSCEEEVIACISDKFDGTCDICEECPKIHGEDESGVLGPLKPAWQIITESTFFSFFCTTFAEWIIFFSTIRS